MKPLVIKQNESGMHTISNVSDGFVNGYYRKETEDSVWLFDAEMRPVLGWSKNSTVLKEQISSGNAHSHK